MNKIINKNQTVFYELMPSDFQNAENFIYNIIMGYMELEYINYNRPTFIGLDAVVWNTEGNYHNKIFLLYPTFEKDINLTNLWIDGTKNVIAIKVNYLVINN